MQVLLSVMRARALICVKGATSVTSARAPLQVVAPALPVWLGRAAGVAEARGASGERARAAQPAGVMLGRSPMLLSKAVGLVPTGC